MPNNWPSRSVLRWMIMSVVRNCEIWITVILSTFSLLLTCFLFWISLHVWCVYYWKNYCIGYLYTQTSQIDCFRRVNKILRWIRSSDFKKVHILWFTLKQLQKKICKINQQNHHCCILKPICTCKYDNDISSIPHDLYDWFLLTALKLFYRVKVTDNRWSGKKPLYWLG